MAKTNAQRQAAYRQRHLIAEDGGAERINLLVSLSAKRKLERLAACYGVTQRALLERLLTDAERALLDRLEVEGRAIGDYYDKKLKPTVTP